MYTEIEQQGLDIDWFFTDGKYIGFMASGGGKLPISVADYKDDYQVLVDYFRNLPEISDVLVNPKLDSLLLKVFRSGADQKYLEDYISMTRKGLYSYDKTVVNNFLDPYYHLVAGPTVPLKLAAVPQDILIILSKTRSLNDIESMQEINILEIG
ncbi:hypothetical protein [Chryseobacterium pennipullorum]|uniref:Uncharacterized protein n=1 Tax=Chryseobacterium pennipullorum TaxID=2258963 RepID=A0A3D9BA61_9FLAO|nr:hypothetical protein [Chryseobacterium pennipullorum]REC50329.1 hypothetical protein DRF67_02025 [Chryseobacterium pennipullorum]